MTDPLDFLLAPGPVEPALVRTLAQKTEEKHQAEILMWVRKIRGEEAASFPNLRAPAVVAPGPAAPVRSPAAQARLDAHIEADRQARLKSK